MKRWGWIAFAAFLGSVSWAIVIGALVHPAVGAVGSLAIAAGGGWYAGKAEDEEWRARR